MTTLEFILVVVVLLGLLVWYCDRAILKKENARVLDRIDAVIACNKADVKAWRQTAVRLGAAFWSVHDSGEVSFQWKRSSRVLFVSSADLRCYPISSGDLKVTPDLIDVEKCKMDEADFIVYFGLADGRYQVVKNKHASLLDALKTVRV